LWLLLKHWLRRERWLLYFCAGKVWNLLVLELWLLNKLTLLRCKAVESLLLLLWFLKWIKLLLRQPKIWYRIWLLLESWLESTVTLVLPTILGLVERWNLTKSYVWTIRTSTTKLWDIRLRYVSIVHASVLVVEITGCCPPSRSVINWLAFLKFFISRLKQLIYFGLARIVVVLATLTNILTLSNVFKAMIWLALWLADVIRYSKHYWIDWVKNITFDYVLK